MLPNHSPLVVAEQFGTLESLFPGRIDLGIGRAPGTDAVAARALRRDLHVTVDTFPHDVLELLSYFEPVKPGQPIRAVPGAGLRVPVWLLGSSLYSAQLAAALGLPFAFASHFAPDALMQALDVYRARFQPSDRLEKPYAMLGVNVVAADTDAEAARLFTSMQQQFVNLRRGTPGQLQPPLDDIEQFWTPAEKAGVEHTLAYAVVGSRSAVRDKLRSFAASTKADELMVTAHIHDHGARVRSYEIVAAVRDELAAERSATAA
jgi:luciferase family oxidoreductase group 1